MEQQPLNDVGQDTPVHGRLRIDRLASLAVVLVLVAIVFCFLYFQYFIGPKLGGTMP